MVKHKLNRSLYALSAGVLAATGILSMWQGTAGAYGQVTERQIKISSSALAATGVSYYVEFKAGTTATVQSIVVDFCQNSPIIGDSCTGTVGTNTPSLGSASADTNGGAGVGNIGTGWTLALTNSNRTVTLSKTGGIAMTAGTAYFFTVNAVTNPSDNDTVTAGNQPGTFYGRILTFPADSGANSAAQYTGANTVANAPTDAGGIALSTASQLTVTSKVQERLSFCVYTGANCAAGGNAVTLGDTNGVLDPLGPYVDKNTKYDISTNAATGAAIRVKGPTLTTGSFTISPIGGTKAQSALGTEQFGFCSYTATGAPLTIDSTYNGAVGASAVGGECQGTSQTAGNGTTGGDNNAYFAFDTNATNGTGSTYGAQFATKAAGAVSTGQLAFVGNIANTTEAGIYTTTLTFIATGTY